LTVSDTDGNVVRRLTGPASSGFHRVAWNLRYPSPRPTSLTPWQRENPWDTEPMGPMALPGEYIVAIAKCVQGVTTPLGEQQSFETTPLANTTLPAADKPALLAFQRKCARLQKAILGTQRVADEAQQRIDLAERALQETPGANQALLDVAAALDTRLKDLLIELEGDRTVSRREEPTSPSISDRISWIIWSHWEATSNVPPAFERQYEIAAEAFGRLLSDLRQLVQVDLRALEAELDAAGAPWTPGRFPVWERD
ncbi:MAG: glycosyl hydrolase, partial [bacterium]